MSNLVAQNDDGTHTHLPGGIEVVITFEIPGGAVYRRTLTLKEVALSPAPEAVLIHAFNHIMGEYIGTLQLQQGIAPEVVVPTAHACKTCQPAGDPEFDQPNPVPPTDWTPEWDEEFSPLPFLLSADGEPDVEPLVEQPANPFDPGLNTGDGI